MWGLQGGSLDQEDISFSKATGGPSAKQIVQEILKDGEVDADSGGLSGPSHAWVETV